jgi:hypothetical protein
MRKLSKHLILIIGGFGLLAGCEEEQPPRSTMEFLDNPIMLEAAMVRCSQNRAATRYDAECMNARLAVAQIEAKEEVVRQAEFDARSKSKRQALRRTQEAAAQARQRAAEVERLRIEAEYLAQFGVAPLSEEQSSEVQIDTGNAPGIAIQPEEETPATDLESIRDELQRRNEEGS